MVDDDEPAVGERLDAVADVGGDDGDEAGAGAGGHAVDGDLDLAVEDLIDLFLGVMVLVDRRAGVEGVVDEGHGVGVEEPAAPAGQPLDDLQGVGVDDGHGLRPPHDASTAAAASRSGLRSAPLTARAPQPHSG